MKINIYKAFLSIALSVAIFMLITVHIMHDSYKKSYSDINFLLQPESLKIKNGDGFQLEFIFETTERVTPIAIYENPHNGIHILGFGRYIVQEEFEFMDISPNKPINIKISGRVSVKNNDIVEIDLHHYGSRVYKINQPIFLKASASPPTTGVLPDSFDYGFSNSIEIIIID